MPARKLTDSETQQIPLLYRQAGENTTTLAERFNVSNSTISRILKDALDPDEYKALSQQKRAEGKSQRAGAGPSRVPPAPPAIPDSPPAASDRALSNRPIPKRRRVAPEVPSPVTPVSGVQLALLGEEAVDPITAQPTAERMAEALEVLQEVKNTPHLRRDRGRRDDREDGLHDLDGLDDLDDPEEDEVDLAVAADLTDLRDLGDLDIEDEDEDDEDEFDDEDEDEDEADEDEDDEDEAEGLDVAVTLKAEVAVQVLPLAEATIPHPFYLVVDRLSELITRPLREFGELGKIPEAEANSRILPIFENHRIARRFSRKNQKVIKVPEAHMLQKTKQHLTAKGINRLLIDGQIYGL